MNDLFKNFTQLLDDYKARIKFYFKNAPFGRKSFWRLLGLPFIDIGAILNLFGKYVQTSNRETDATEEDLDSVATRHGIERKPATTSTVYLKFTAPNTTPILEGSIVQTDQSVNVDVVSFITESTDTVLEYTASTISFDNATNTINDSANGFTFSDGDFIYIEGTTLNDGIFQIETQTASVLTISDSFVINTEASGSSFITGRCVKANSRITGDAQNVGPETLIVLTNAITGVTEVTNPEESFGGIDKEVDGDLWRGWENDDALEDGETNEIDTDNFRGRILDAIFNNRGKVTKSGYEQTVINGVPTIRTAYAINDFDYQGGYPDLINIFLVANHGTGIPSAQDILDAEALFVWDTEIGDKNRDTIDTMNLEGVSAVNISCTYSVTPTSQYNTTTLKAQLKTTIEERITSLLFNLDNGEDVLMEAVDNIVYQTAGVYNMVRTLPASDTTVNVDEKAVAGTLLITVV